MIRRNLTSLMFLGSMLCATFLHAADKQRPNILFIFADDLAYDCVAALGNDRIRTPHIDRLVRDGTTFTHAYHMGAYPAAAVCTASRTMLFTGRFIWSAYQAHKRADDEREIGRWWPSYLKDTGYETYMTGKWHMRASAEKSFDHLEHERSGMPEATEVFYNRPKADGSDPWDPADPSFGGYWEGGKHWSEVMADDAKQFLARAAKIDKPFFMYIAFNAPHDPRQSPQKYQDMYPLDSIRTPQPFYAQYPFRKHEIYPLKLRDERLAPHPRTEHMMRVHRREYYAIITHLDQQIGRIRAALESTGKADNTVIVFTSDNGLACGHHGLLGKQNMYNHSVRVPFVLVGPGIAPNRRIDTPIYLQDIMPTTLEWAGVSPRPDHVDFKSLNPLLSDPDAEHYDAIYNAYKDTQRAVTADGYKLILYPQIPVARLYHLAEDPLETIDLADRPGSEPIMKRLFGKLLAWQPRARDELDLASAYPTLAAQ